jgi:2-dehydropantoate 2-reductase
MRVCVYGAGAIGGFLAGRLSLAGHDVVAVARGAHLEAIRRDGLTLVGSDGRVEKAAGVRGATPDEVGPVDLLVVTLKAHQIPPLAREIARLSARAAVTVPLQNGIPWWYFHRHGGAHEGLAVEAVDPGGAVAAAIGTAGVVPAIAAKSAEVEAPGIVRHVVTHGDRFPMGELDGAMSGRLAETAGLFKAAGIPADAVPDIRTEVWAKLLGNLPLNPLGALTGATIAGTVGHPHARELCLAMMREALLVAAAFGAVPAIDPEARIRRSESIGEVKASMLQDLERGRPMEVGAIIGAVVDLAGIAGIPVPSTRAVHACASLLADRRRARESGR